MPSDSIVWWTGSATCMNLQCGFVWTVLCPEGTDCDNMECPSCGNTTGVMPEPPDKPLKDDPSGH